MDKLTSEQRHYNMSQIKSKDTKIERVLRHALWDRGYRYRKNYEKLPGKPDIVLTKFKIVIFCDSEFFHGKDYDKLMYQLSKSNNSEFWTNKIKKNIERDSNVDKELKSQGWTVLRFWGKDILKDVDSCIQVIEETIFEQMLQDNNDFEENL